MLIGAVANGGSMSLSLTSDILERAVHSTSRAANLLEDQFVYTEAPGGF